VPQSLFISDLHLDPQRPAVTAAFADFLARESTTCGTLYILGDLFEAWIGDDDDAPLARRVAGLLRDFTAQGKALYIMPGNRDFLLGQAFCDAVGATLLQDPTRVTLGTTAVLLMHGDTLCTRDSDYQAFRALTQDPGWRAEILDKSLAERRRLAAHLREGSRQATGNKPEAIMDVTQAEVDREMAAHDVGVLIHGHTHRPARHEVARGIRYVLGDWGQRGWVLRAVNGEINLEYFYIEQ
jgi:UDP-2,3-diacylglucosamine hydrolase